MFGAVDNLEETKGKAARLRIGKYKIDSRDLLPTPDGLAQHLRTAFHWVDPITGDWRTALAPEGEPLQCCSVAGGDRHPPSPLS